MELSNRDRYKAEREARKPEGGYYSGREMDELAAASILDEIAEKQAEIKELRSARRALLRKWEIEDKAEARYQASLAAAGVR